MRFNPQLIRGNSASEKNAAFGKIREKWRIFPSFINSFPLVPKFIWECIPPQFIAAKAKNYAVVAFSAINYQ